MQAITDSLKACLEAVHTDCSKVPGVTSALTGILISRNRIPLEDLEKVEARKNMVETIMLACTMAPPAVADVTLKLFARSLISRISVPWNAGEDFRIIQYLREAFTGLQHDLETAVRKEFPGLNDPNVEYWSLISGWLTEFGSLARLVVDERQLFETSGDRLEPTKLLSPLIENYPLLYDHQMVQDGIQYLGTKLQGLVGYHAMLNYITASTGLPKTKALMTLSMVREYFEPTVKPPYRKFPQTALAAFDLDTDSAKSWIAKDLDSRYFSISQLYANAAYSRDPLLVLGDPPKTHVPGHVVCWRHDLDSLLTIPIKRLALDVPTIVQLFEDAPNNLTEEQKETLTAYTTSTADMMARLPDLAATGGPEEVIRTLVLRGFTKSNCELYIQKAEALWGEDTDGTIIGDFLGAVVYTSLIGLAAHSMYTYNPRTLQYSGHYAGLISDFVDPYSHLLRRVGVSESELLLPLRSFAPAPSEDALNIIRDTLVSVIDGSDGGAEALGDLVVFDFVQRLISDLGGKTQENLDWLERREKARDKGYASADEQSYTYGFEQTVELVQAIEVGGAEPEEICSRNGTDPKIDMQLFSNLFVATVLRDIVYAVSTYPFTVDAVQHAVKLLSWARDFGLSENLSDTQKYRRAILEFQLAVSPFITKTNPTEKISIESASAIEKALLKISDACDRSLDTLPETFKKTVQPVPAVDTMRSKFISQAFEQAATRDLEEVSKTLNNASMQISTAVQILLSKTATIRTLLSQSANADFLGNVSFSSCRDKKELGHWKDDTVMQAIWKAVNFAETAIRHTEKAIRALDSTKVKTHALETTYWQLAGNAQTRSHICRKVAEELSGIADARNTVVQRSWTLCRSLAGVGVKRARDVVKAWKTFSDNEAALETSNPKPEDVVKVIGAASALLDIEEGGTTTLEGKLEEIEISAPSKEDTASALTLLGPPDARGYQDTSSNQFITEASDITSWDKTNKAPLYVRHSTKEGIDNGCVDTLPDKLISSETLLTVSDRVLESANVKMFE